MKSRNSIRTEINNIYTSKVASWLSQHVKNNHEIEGFPFRIFLGAPANEEEIASNKEAFLAFCEDWHKDLVAGKVDFLEKEFKCVGKVEVPVHLVFENPSEIVAWCGHLVEFRTALYCLDTVAERIPALIDSALANIHNITSLEYIDFNRFVEVCRWILKSPNSGKTIRQMRIRGVDSAWFERYRNLLLLFLRDYLKLNSVGKDLRQLGLVPPPSVVKIVVLDESMRAKIGNLRYIASPVADAAHFSIAPQYVLFMEDLSSALALPDIPRTVAVILPRSGLKDLCALPWIANASTVFLGSVNLTALVHLNNVRVYLPNTESRLLSETVFCENQDLWAPDYLTPQDVPLESPLLLTEAESSLYSLFVSRIFKNQSVGIVQERIPYEMLCQAAGAIVPQNDEELNDESEAVTASLDESKVSVTSAEEAFLSSDDISKDEPTADVADENSISILSSGSLLSSYDSEQIQEKDKEDRSLDDGDELIDNGRIDSL